MVYTILEKTLSFVPANKKGYSGVALKTSKSQQRDVGCRLQRSNAQSVVEFLVELVVLADAAFD